MRDFVRVSAFQLRYRFLHRDPSQQLIQDPSRSFSNTTRDKVVGAVNCSGTQQQRKRHPNHVSPSISVINQRHHLISVYQRFKHVGSRKQNSQAQPSSLAHTLHELSVTAHWNCAWGGIKREPLGDHTRNEDSLVVALRPSILQPHGKGTHTRGRDSIVHAFRNTSATRCAITSTTI